MTAPLAARRQRGLEAMLWAESVAVVGASPRPSSLPRRVMTELAAGGFRGRIVPVTPSHPEVLGLATVGSLAEVDPPVDLAILAVADSRLEAQMIAAAEASVGGVVIFGPAVGETAAGVSLRDRLAGIAREAGIAVCGPNGMGFVNVEHRLRATGFYQPPHLTPGGVAFISHSGSLFSAMLHNRRQLHFNVVVSTGLEIVNTTDEYLDHLLDLPSTTAVGLFAETIRRPEAMAATLDRAWNLDVPVVALKVGRTDRARRAATTHSGALAGDDAAYDAYLEAHHVHRVDTPDELADALGLFSARVRARKGALGAVGDSGGERALLIDVAAATGVSFAAISEETRTRLAAVLEPGLEPDNPVDAWGTGHDAERIFEESLRALADDPAVGAVAFCVDLTAEEDPREGYLPFLESLRQSLPVPLVVIANLTAGIDPDQAARLRRLGIPVLEGTASGLRAVSHLLTRAEWRQEPPPGALPDVGEEVRSRWRERLAGGGVLSESEGLALVADYGIDAVAHRVVASPRAAVAAARDLGWPVALKTHGGPAHKTEVDGVRLGLADEQALRAAYQDLAARLGPEMIVQPMVREGVELALGIVNDEQLGPLVVVGAGGRLVELIGERALCWPPLVPARAERLLECLRVTRLLDGYRGEAAPGRGAAVSALAAVAAIASDLGDLLGGLDINPLVVTEGGAVAVDVLVVAGGGE